MAAADKDHEQDHDHEHERATVITRQINRLFVYGTLAPGRPNEHILADVPGEWESGTVNGRLFEEGWGAAAGYPGIVLDKEAGDVEGLLFSSETLGEHWSRLDEFEGDGYQRVITTVKRRNGPAVEAFIYELRPKRVSASP